MLSSIIKKIFGDQHAKDIKEITPILEEINHYFTDMSSLTDEELQGKTDEFRARLTAGETTDDLLPEAFATVKETCRRLCGTTSKVCNVELAWEMIPYDVQIIGAVVLHKGKIAEMATGEGKTLVATMPAYLNALSGKGVHVITVNDYLASRDSEWMGRIYTFLGLTVGCIKNDMEPQERQQQYACDITYGTNNEFGFDYLRDNMVIDKDDLVQRGHHYTIIDEVDNILIDEARTPLIISGPVAAATNQFAKLKPAVEQIIRLQRDIVTQKITEIEKRIKDEELDNIKFDLITAYSGGPKNKRLRKILENTTYKKLLQEGESHFLSKTQSKTAETISEEEYFEDLYYYIDEKRHSIDLTQMGRDILAKYVKDPDLFLLPDVSTELSMIEGDDSLSDQKKQEMKDDLDQRYSIRSEYIQNMSQLLRAYTLFEKDNEYVVQDNKVQIVDEFTGRLMPGRRYSDGLHQALEAKEGVRIEAQTQTMATITIQNFFRLYDKLSGMTGTAETEARELYDIYKLDVVVIPTNRPIRRLDHNDLVYRTKREKYNAIIDHIIELHTAEKPILVGTISVEVSELLSRMLKRRGIPHNVLNAKQHLAEAEVVARAGRPGAVTIATNMAGRGTDIKLSDDMLTVSRETLNTTIKLDDKLPEAGTTLRKFLDENSCGLHVLGTSRHESRRIDRQLRGRSGRQGDPGMTVFYISMEDDLMRLFGSDRMVNIMNRLGAEEGEVITHGMITKAIERAQKKVEGRNYSIRKHLLEYDNVMNQQREVIYDRRLHALEGKHLNEDTNHMIEEFCDDIMAKHADEKSYPEAWDMDELKDIVYRTCAVDVSLTSDQMHGIKYDDYLKMIEDHIKEAYLQRKSQLGPEIMQNIQKAVILGVIDQKWRDHLWEMDQLKEGIGLRAYGQKDPLIEYKKESYHLFVDLINAINVEVLRFIFHAEPAGGLQANRPHRPQPSALQTVHATTDNMGLQAPPPPPGTPTPEAPPSADGKLAPIKRNEPKVGRNDPCPCGSNKKYKKCCGVEE